MKLTTELLAVFTGGQIEMQHLESRHLYRGQIKEATVDEVRYDLRVSFDWLAQGAGWPGKVTAWARVPVANIGPRNLGSFTVFDIGKDGIRLTSGIGKDMLFFFPPNYYSNIDPSHVSGLVLPVAPAA